MKIMNGFGKIVCCILAVLLLVNPITVFADQAEDISITNGCHTLDGTTPLLGTGAFTNTQTAILYEVNSDTLLFSLNPDQRMDPSSFAKIVTAMVAIEDADLAEIVVADELTLDTLPWDAVSAGIQAGEEISLLDLLYCMLVGSGNDAAAVIAVHIGGTMDKFAQRMNEFMTSIGCTNSNFTNSHGLYDEDQYTSARDIAKLMAYATQNETFVKLIGAKDYVVPATNKRGERILTTNNHLISRSVMSVYYDSRVTGGRTGVAGDGSRCLAATAKQGSMNLISVVMGCRNIYASGGTISTFGSFPETSALLDKGFQGMRAVQIFSPGQVLKQYPLANADANLYIGVQDSRKTVLPTGVGTDDLRYIYQENGVLTAPVQKNAPFGTVSVYYGSICIATAPLYALNRVDVLQEDVITDRHEPPKDGISTGIILAVLAVLFILALIFLRYSKKFKRIIGKKRQRRRRM